MGAMRLVPIASARIFVAALLLMIALPAHAPAQHNWIVPYPASSRWMPAWEERVINQLVNRARVDPAAELAGCTGCSAAELSGCYGTAFPLTYATYLNRAARFHSTFMSCTGVLHNSTSCPLRGDISALYPKTCNGCPECACLHDQTGVTEFGSRIGLFLGRQPEIAGESIARSSASTSPVDLFYTWLHEPAPGATCSETDQNRNRWAILKFPGGSVSAGHVGTSSDGWWTLDFGPGTDGSYVRLISGAHWTPDGKRQGSTVEFWANLYGSAAPLFVIVDGTPFAMEIARSSFWSSLTVNVSGLETGCHRYYFAGAEYRYPATGTFGVGDPLTCGDWSPPAGDLNFDGWVDLLWYRETTGDVNVWYLMDSAFKGGRNLFQEADADWKIAASGDFDGDGKTDLIWRNGVTGDVRLWKVDGDTITEQADLYRVADLNWRIETAGDFDGDGKYDIIWRNYATGAVHVWFLDGATYISGGQLLSVADPSWEIAGSADFNRDGKRDLLWRNHATGDVNVWLLSGIRYGSGAKLFNVPDPNWQIEAIGDYNGDGKPDLIWRNYASGAVNVWFLDGTKYVSGAALYSVPDANWKIAGPR
jgi:hypothetical protein